MKLKEFVKEVLHDVTYAISDSQNELQNGAIINIGNTHMLTDGTMETSYPAQNIDFDVAVTTSTDKGGNVSIDVFNLPTRFGFKLLKNRAEVSRVKFTIPVVYPRPNKKYEETEV